MTAAKINVDGRKYTVVIDNGKLSALRYGEPWRDLSGDNLVYWLAVELQAAREALQQMVDMHDSSARSEYEGTTQLFEQLAYADFARELLAKAKP